VRIPIFGVRATVFPLFRLPETQTATKPVEPFIGFGGEQHNACTTHQPANSLNFYQRELFGFTPMTQSYALVFGDTAINFESGIMASIMAEHAS